MDELTPAETWARWLRPRDYVLVRWLMLRLLGFVFVFAFLGIIYQGLPLLGSHGLTPAASLVDELHRAGKTFWDVPSVFMWDCSDAALQIWAYVGLVLAIACMLGYANLPSLVLLWLIYGSYERIGQDWWAFGWEIQILETTLIAAFIAHPWDPRPLAARPPPTAAIVLARWLVFRIMLGAGLIKLRGGSCWTELTCLDTHFETQPLPNPLSPWFHHLPHAMLAVGVAFNHFVEVICPWFVFGPRPLRLVAACSMLAFQGVLVLSGNLSFLNWLTIIPVLACFDDDAVLWLVPRRWRDRLRTRCAPRVDRNAWQLWLALAIALGLILTYDNGNALEIAVALIVLAVPAAFAAHRGWRAWLVPRLGRVDPRQLVLACFCALVVFKSWRVVDNLTSHHQAMNAAYDRLALVNTYGAFGSVGDERYELLIEGTMVDNPEAPDDAWRTYELPCKPGDLARRPCVLGPYHLRLDWKIWFAAMYPRPNENEAWVIHLVWKLLDGDRGVRELLAVDPFDGKPPKWLRIRRARYHFATGDQPGWWTREEPEPWLDAVSLDSDGLKQALAQFGWPSPTLH